MIKRVKILPFLLLVSFQVLPILIILHYMYDYKGATENSGWIVEKNGDCKFFTETNHENRVFEWNGDCHDGFIHGYGQLKLFENNIEYYVFEGFLSKGRIEGYGKLIMLSDGDTYEGNYANGKAHGLGHFFNDDGDHYEGHFKNGLRSGKGTYWYGPESKLFKYVGEWEDGKQNGEGTLFYRNGKTVSGHFIDGVLEGDSTLE